MSILPVSIDPVLRPAEFESRLLRSQCLVFAWARRHGFPVCDAEDIAEIAVIRLVRWPRLLRYPIGGWIDRLARQCVKEHCKWSRRVVALMADPDTGSEEYQEFSAPEVATAFSRLGLRDQYALGYWAITGLSTGSVAAVLQCSEAAAVKAIQRAKRRLLEILLAERVPPQNILSRS